MNKYAKKEIKLAEYYNAFRMMHVPNENMKYAVPLMTLIDAYQGQNEKLEILQDICDEYVKCSKDSVYGSLDYDIDVDKILIPEYIHVTLCKAAKSIKLSSDNTTTRENRIKQNIHKLLDNPTKELGK